MLHQADSRSNVIRTGCIRRIQRSVLVCCLNAELLSLEPMLCIQAVSTVGSAVIETAVLVVGRVRPEGRARCRDQLHMLPQVCPDVNAPHLLAACLLGSNAMGAKHTCQPCSGSPLRISSGGVSSGPSS